MSDQVTFRASFPAIQSAIKRSGDGGGMRIQLDIPESEMASAVLLLAMTNQVLLVTIEPEPEDHERTRTPHRRTAKQRE
jgi:hypothetical protein